MVKLFHNIQLYNKNIFVIVEFTIYDQRLSRHISRRYFYTKKHQNTCIILNKEIRYFYINKVQLFKSIVTA